MSEHQRLQEQLHQQQLMREDHVEEDEEEEDDEVLQPGEYGGEEYYGEWSVLPKLIYEIIMHATPTALTALTEVKEQNSCGWHSSGIGTRVKENQDRSALLCTPFPTCAFTPAHSALANSFPSRRHQLSVVTSPYFRSSLTYFALFSGHFGTESQHAFATIRIRHVKWIGHRIDAVDCLVLLIRRTSVLCWGCRRVCGGRL